MSDLEDFIDFIQYLRRNRYVGPRRYLRDFSNPFEKYSAREFYSRFRFSPNTVHNTLLPMIQPDLQKPSRRGLPFSPEIMLLVTLRFYATGSFQKMDGDTMGICQQSVSRIILKVSTLIARRMKNVVKFPSSSREINRTKERFFEIAQFPGVIGCIDCTHIKIRSPGGPNSEVFRNRKTWFSMNVQAVVGPNLQFYDLVARWPGSTHDSFIYNSSSVKQRLQSGQLQGVLLGDSGYAVSNVLYTPFLSPSTNAQKAYNTSQIKTRNVVERAFGVWKRRFPCLQVGMGIKLETVVAVICACAALHNICCNLNDFSFDISNDDVETVEALPVRENPGSNGFIARQCLVDRFFTE